MPSSSHSIVILFLVVFCLLNLLIPGAETSTQGQDRIIEKQSFSREPVKIRVVKTKKGEVKLGENFTDAEEWFKGLTLEIENTSGKAITYIGVLLLFPRPKDDKTAQEPPFGESLKYGISPFAPIGSIKSNQVQPVPDGGIIHLTLSEELYGIVRQFLEKNKYPRSINKIVLSIEDIGFIDGTAWSAGQLWRRDSANPEKWSLIEQSQGSVNNHAGKVLMSDLGFVQKGFIIF